MPKSSAVHFTLAAALVIASGTSPALAKGNTRSFQSLPSALSHRPVQPAASSFVQPSPAVGRSSGIDRTPAISSRGSGALRGRFNWINPGHFTLLFASLPPRLQQIVAAALADAGVRGQNLCRLLGIPECQLPDSTG